MTNEAVFLRRLDEHRKKHPQLVQNCDVCIRVKAWVDSNQAPAESSPELSFVHPHNDPGEGLSDKPWKRQMRKKNCHYCGRPKAGTIDHKVPQAKGGKDCQSNCVPSCPKCNQLKGEMSYDAFLEYLKKKKAGTLTP